MTTPKPLPLGRSGSTHDEEVGLTGTDDVAQVKLSAPRTTQDGEGAQQQRISSSPACTGQAAAGNGELGLLAIYPCTDISTHKHAHHVRPPTLGARVGAEVSGLGFTVGIRV